MTGILKIIQIFQFFILINISRKNEEWLRQQNQSDKHDEMKEKMMKSGMLPRGQSELELIQ